MRDIMPFDEWKQMLIEEGYPNVDEARLALNTLQICLSDIQIDKETENIDEDTFKIAEDGYALFDYAMFCYFLFRARLCSDFPRQFVERYDTFVQNLLPLYFDCCFDIPQETIKRLITSRAIEYEKLAASPNDVTTKEMIETLVDFMERDFCGEPECKEVVITNFHSRWWVTIKVTNYVKITFEALEREIKPILCRDTVKEFPKINPEAIQRAIAKQEELKSNDNRNDKKNENTVSEEIPNKSTGMKILIWIACMAANALLYVIIREILALIMLPAYDDVVAVLYGLLNGIAAGGCFGFCWWLAKRLCKKLDQKRIAKKQPNRMKK